MYLSQKLLDRLEQKLDPDQERLSRRLHHDAVDQQAQRRRARLLREIMTLSRQRLPPTAEADEQTPSASD